MLNKVFLIGHVGNDPEVNYVKEDVPVAKFSLATTETYTSRDGEKISNTEWHNIVAWRGLAKVIEKYVKKGSKLYIGGKITYRKYEKDGETKYYTDIIIRELKMLDSRASTNSDNKNSFKVEKTNNDSKIDNKKEEKQIVKKDSAPATQNNDFEEFSDLDDLPF